MLVITHRSRLARAAGIFMILGLLPFYNCSKKTEVDHRASAGSLQAEPRVILLDPHHLLTVKERLMAGDPAFIPAFKKLQAEADKALHAGPFSVTFKKHLPPSGNQHDFMSLAPYWWPDPNSPNGLPYIRRDGETNPEREEYDLKPFQKLDTAVTTLALAYYFTGQEPYAAHAATLLKTWFLDEATYMNPHLNYGEAIRGICDGRAAGIIGSRALFRIADALGLLAGSKSWTGQDQEKLIKWYEQYLEWLLNSDIGKDESGKKNNHGTWYEVQVSALALFLDKPEIARTFLAKMPKRIESQIQPDGSQPLELVRTRAFHYSSMNVEGLFHAAILGEKVGLDLWSFSTSDGRSIRRALDYLTVFAIKEKPWPHPMIRGWEKDLDIIAALLHQASAKFKEPAYNLNIRKLADVDTLSGRYLLLYPAMESQSRKGEM